MFLLASLLLLIASYSLADSSCGYLGSRFFNRHSRAIIGGQEITTQDVPWVVRVNAPKVICSGTIISDRHVITAGHCFADYYTCENEFEPELDWSICYKEDTNNRECSEDRKYRFKKVLLLDRYLNSNCSRPFDLVILELERPILSAIPVCLPFSQSQLNYGEKRESVAHVLGYSDNYDLEGDPDHPNTHLMHSSTDVLLVRDHPDGGTFLISPNDPAKAAFCGGDSGGPMFEIHNGRAVLIGVNTEAYGNCTINGIIPVFGKSDQLTVEVKQHLEIIASVLRGRL